MKKNILIALIVVMLVVVAVVVYRSAVPAPSSDKAALDQVLSDQGNPSQTSGQQQAEPQTDTSQGVNQPATADQPASQSNSDQTANQPNQNNQQNNMGLQIQTTQQGTGAAVKAGDTVSVKYTGKLTDGTVFDSTDSHGGQPFSFTVGAGQVIAGWDQGLIGMKVGEKRTLTIPGSLAYGAQGIPGTIPPNATLVFDIELVSIK